MNNKTTTIKQPVIFDDYGVLRFKENRLVSHLLDEHGLNRLLIERDIIKEEYEQLMQLIGYSLSGYCDLNNVSEESKDEAWELLEDIIQENN